MDDARTTLRTARRFAVGAVLALTLVAVGCGDDAADDDATATTVDQAPDGTVASSTTAPSAESSTTESGQGSAQVESEAMCALFDDETFRQAWVPTDMLDFVVDSVEVVPVVDGSVAAPANGCVRRVVVSFEGLTGTSDSTVTVDAVPFTDDLITPGATEGTFLAAWEPVAGRPDMYLARLGSVPLAGMLVVDGTAHRISTGEISSTVDSPGVVLGTDEETAAYEESIAAANAAAAADTERDLMASLEIMAERLG